ncbi:hypothetical protein KP509_29G007700 [Ceratopteris richardii]|uniref:SBP-type domain-containing protein n=1 Tax=Ceratopteris richardii TaxID=49495 RepID=A0A8T2R4H9_CERRI|nr:hypothetical protein KP509_29G007700 [Ceratopteris richardii]KAH7291230.1 hypothetical protein KP509_29G007700 [Ceratopteris richardii]KAH7291231.1 hypothetical protein KP509_29G007700 [Ceratopteris richardii]KAH7291232.1 hypothetical protein KP509_29G007700 [Ceratopteris richardii]KAH7291233.1 hypothetical protein KP509_29G007700 [Ceratopteris richardii]
MAWDPNSSPWDWETDGVLVTNHVNGADTCKLLIASGPCGAEPSQTRQDGPSSQITKEFCSSDPRLGPVSQNCRVDLARDGSIHPNRVVTPAISNIHGSISFNGLASHSSVGPGLHVRVPILTTCINNGAFLGVNDHGNGSLASVVQKRRNESEGDATKLSYMQGLGVHDYPGGSESKSKVGVQHVGHADDELCLVVKSNGRESLNNSKHLSDKSMGSICNGDRTNAVDEQRSGKGTGSSGSGDSPTGLQLGKRTYPLDVVAPPPVGKVAVKLQPVAKKGRGSSVAAQVPRCQVEGCNLDLSSSKDYHRRHKVCEPHSKAGKVVVAGLEQRFCQQCSRFHVLAEFDETKRSCRRRLAGHNKRRRKPQPDPLELHARLRSSLEDWPLFYQKYPILPFWQEVGKSRSNVLWPRKLLQYHDQPNVDYSLQTLGLDMSVKSSSPSVNRDKFPLLLLQSPKTYLPMSSSDPRVHEYALNNHMDNGLSLASSSREEAGVITGLGPTPATEVTRVSDSGRALSLLSLHSQCSQALDMVSLDLSGLSNTTITHNHHVQETHSSQQFLLQSQQPCCQGFSTCLTIASNLHLPAAADVCEAPRVINSDKDFYECSFLDNLHRYSVYELNQQTASLNVQMQGHDTTGQGKQTQDLMQLASFQVSNANTESPSAVYNVESSGALGDSQFSSETFFLKF